uniref:Link domain-containing protein n=1 Tax=Echeneis naucrates TaxID=173247 RepID=A0A665UQI4_ECHNA
MFLTSLMLPIFYTFASCFHHIIFNIAGIFQASSLNAQNQLEYFFNASEARTLCLTLGVNIASKAQVQEALRRGLETCRFGWIDEHFAVIPRIRSLSNCGQNQKGLVTWRASVKQKFDFGCHFFFCMTYAFFLYCFIVLAKIILITSTCAVLLVAMIILAYIKL